MVLCYFGTRLTLEIVNFLNLRDESIKCNRLFIYTKIDISQTDGR